MDRTDIEELRESGTSLVFAVGQAPFEVAGRGVKNVFCLLVPLMTERGIRFHDLEGLFPNRGRVWWMLRQDIDPHVIQPGMVWSGTIEHSIEGATDKPDKDFYQANKRTLRPGASDFTEVLDIDREIPLPELLRNGVRFHRQPLAQVLLRSQNSITGPFSASYDRQTSQVHFAAVKSGDPFVLRAPREALDKMIQEFSFKARASDLWESPRDVRVCLIPDSYEGTLAENGERLDAASDAQIANWALRLLRFSQKQQQEIKEVLHRAQEYEAAAHDTDQPQRWQRFATICGDSETITTLGVDAARMIAEQPAFAELVNRHKDELLEKRVEEEIAKHTSEISAAITAEKEHQKRLREDIAKLDEEYNRKTQLYEERFRKDNEGRIHELEDREAQAARREADLQTREREIKDRLERVIDTYRDKSVELGDQIIAQIPLLARTGIFGTSPHHAAEQPPVLLRPAFLDQPRDVRNITEQDFLTQFAHVANTRGFSFESDDLINFHVSVKIGSWTILAGASGLGKSSLSRLYAEALGVSDEYLLLPVRPDWLDDREVIGAFNALSGRYEPAAGGLVDRLVAAYEDARTKRGGLYIICLDEMNLSRVEHYFSAFLSLLEQPLEQRRLSLFAAGLERPDDPYAPYRLLPVGENVRFVGTVNIDETTHFFSPKVLDRASVVRLDRPSLRQEMQQVIRHGALGGIVPVHLDDYHSWIADGVTVSSGIKDLLVHIDEALRHARSGLGFRIRDRMLAYIASARGLVNEEGAFDLAFLTNVAPRLRPNAPGWKRVLDSLQGLLPAGRFPRSADAMKTMADTEGEHGFFLLT